MVVFIFVHCEMEDDDSQMTPLMGVILFLGSDIVYCVCLGVTARRRRIRGGGMTYTCDFASSRTLLFRSIHFNPSPTNNK